MNEKRLEHPAKYSNEFINIFANELIGYNKVLDPMAGTGKIGKIKECGFNGEIYANEIEPEWLEPNDFNCDFLSYTDAANLPYTDNYFDAICTSPTYGNRMADHHIAKDNSKRNTYTHCLGRQLNNENTGKMQFGDKYINKHVEIYNELYRVLNHNGKLVINISNHIRKGMEIDVCEWSDATLQKIGFKKIKEYNIETKRNRYGSNGNKRVKTEKIMIYTK